MTEPVDPNVIFISHNAVDLPYAKALECLIKELLDNQHPVDVPHSTNPPAGPEGARAVARMDLRADCGRRYHTNCDHPTCARQALGTVGSGRGEGSRAGAEPLDLRTEIRFIMQAFAHNLLAINAATKRAPSLVNEANVQNWLARLDKLASGERLSELGGFERWMMLVFGREVNEDPRAGGIPIDVRLHRRIGEYYLHNQQCGRAVHQLRLAWRAAPRDIFVLRPLAVAGMKSLLARGDSSADAELRANIRTLLDAIRELDEHAYVASPDAAGLLAKYCRRVEGEPERALKVYVEAFQINPDSYYLVDLLAQTELELSRYEAARIGFRRALEIIARLDGSNIWSHATATTACVGLSDLEDARKHLMEVQKAGPPSHTQIGSIAIGIREVGARVGLQEEAVNELTAVIEARSDAA